MDGRQSKIPSLSTAKKNPFKSNVTSSGANVLTTHPKFALNNENTGFTSSLNARPSMANRYSSSAMKQPTANPYYSGAKKNSMFATPQVIRSSMHGNIPMSSHSRRSSIAPDRKHMVDTRPLSDKAYHDQCISKILSFLSKNNYQITKQALNSPSTKEVEKLFTFFFGCLDVAIKPGSIEVEIPRLYKEFGYPFQINKSSLLSFSTSKAKGTLFSMFEWIVDLIEYSLFNYSEKILFGSNYDEFINVDKELLKVVLNNDIENKTKYFKKIEEAKYGTEDQVNELEEEEIMHKEAIKKLDNEIDELKVLPANLKAYKDQFLKFKQYYDEMETNIEEMNKELDKCNIDINSKKEEIKKLNNNIEALSAQIKNQKYTADDLVYFKQRDKQLDKEIAIVENEMKDLKAKFFKKSLEKNELEDQISRVYFEFISCISNTRTVILSLPVKNYTKRLSDELESDEINALLEFLKNPTFYEKKVDEKNDFLISYKLLIDIISEIFIDLKSQTTITAQSIKKLSKELVDLKSSKKNKEEKDKNKIRNLENKKKEQDKYLKELLTKKDFFQEKIQRIDLKKKSIRELIFNELENEKKILKENKLLLQNTINQYKKDWNEIVKKNKLISSSFNELIIIKKQLNEKYMHLNNQVIAEETEMRNNFELDFIFL